MKDYRQTKIKLIAGGIDLIGSCFFYNHSKKVSGVKKILLLKFDRLGDTFMALPTIAALRQGFPESKLVVLAAPWNKEVLEHNPDIDRLTVVSGLPDVWSGGVRDFLRPKLVRRLIKVIREEQADLAVDLQGSPLNILAMYKAGVKYRVGFGPKLFSFLLTHQAQYQSSWLQSKIYLSLAAVLSLPAITDAGELHPTVLEQAKVASFVAEQGGVKLVVFHLGAGRSYRMWPINYFVELAELILDSDYNIKLIVFGSEAEKERVNEFKKTLGVNYENRLLDISGQFNFREFYHLLSLAHSFIGNDSAPARLAGAVGIPTVCIFNPWSGVERFGIEGKRVKMLYSSIHNCRGQFCSLDPCPNMAAIKPAAVLAAWQDIID